jgi:tRNA threonylcarbamoyladenosine biosynthesis protein TsaE
MGMDTFISHSADETASLGERLASQVRRGQVLALSGDLGAGKTQFVKGFARGLGIVERVQSPTFALVNGYPDGRLPLYHLDLYRLESERQIVSAGLEAYLEPDGVAVIEWAERLVEAGLITDSHPPANLRWVRFEIVNETERRVTYEDPRD